MQICQHMVTRNFVNLTFDLVKSQQSTRICMVSSLSNLSLVFCTTELIMSYVHVHFPSVTRPAPRRQPFWRHCVLVTQSRRQWAGYCSSGACSSVCLCLSVCCRDVLRGTVNTIVVMSLAHRRHISPKCNVFSAGSIRLVAPPGVCQKKTSSAPWRLLTSRGAWHCIVLRQKTKQLQLCHEWYVVRRHI